MVASGVGQYSINVKSNLKDFYGELTKSQRTLKELTERKNQLNIDSSKLTELRDKAQRIAAEMKELRQQKTEIKLGIREVDDAKTVLKNLDQQIASLNRQKLEVEAEIQPIRTANVELYKTEQEIERINGQKVSIDFSKAGDNLVGFGDRLDSLGDKIVGVVKKLATLGTVEVAAIGKIAKDAVNEASDLEQNIGGVQKLFGDDASKKVITDSTKAYKEAGISQNEYLEQSTTFSASLIKALEEGQTKTSDSSAQKAELKKKKQEIEKLIKQNRYNSSEVSLNITDSKAKKQELTEYKRNALELKKQKDKIDEQIANLPDKTTEQVNKLSQKDAQKQAADYAKQAIIDMSDNANVFGTNIGLIQNAYQGFSKNNFTMLDNLKLGFAGSQQGAMDLINAYGGLDHEVTDISEATMPLMIKSIHNAQEAMKISGTTIKEAAKTYEGSLKAMKSAWKDFLATGDTSGLAETVPVYFDNLDKKLKELTPKIIEGIKTLVKELPPKLKPVIKDIQNILTQSLDEIFGKGFTKNFTDGMKPFTNIVKTIFDTLSKSSKGKKPDLSWMGSVVPDLLKVVTGLKVAGIAFKGVGGLLKVAGFIQNLGFKFPSFKGLSGFAKSTKEIKQISVNDLKNLGMKMITIAGISGNIYLAANALEEVQKVGNLKGLQPKLLAIAEAVTGMSVISAALGKGNDLLSGSVTSGLLLIVGISADIFLVAKALEEVANINGDFGSLQSKIGQIALAVTEIGILAGAIGLVMDTGIGAVALVSGLVAIIGITGTLYLVAVALKKVSKINLDRDIIESNINSISKVVKSMSKMTFNENLIIQLDKILSQLLNLALIGELIGIGKELEKIQELDLDYSSINNNLDSISKGITAVANIKYNESLVTSFLKGGIVRNLKKVVDEIIEITNKFENLQGRSIICDSLTSQIKAIREGISAITGVKFNESVVTSWLKDGIVGNIKSVIGTIQEIADEFEDIQGRSLISNSLTTSIETVQTGISAITGIKFNESIVSSFLKNGVSGNIKSMIQTLLDIANDFEDIQGKSLIEDSLINEIGIIQKGIDSITGIKFNESVLSSFLKGGISNNIKSLINTLIDTTSSFEDIQGRSLVEDSLTGEIATIQTGISAITGIKFNESALSSFLKKGISGNIKNLINTLLDIADSFEDLQGRSLILNNITNDEGNGEIDIIQKGISAITGIKFNESMISSFLKGGVSDNVKNMISTIIKIADNLENLQGRSLMVDSITNDENTGEIDIIQTAINKIAGIKFNNGIGVNGMKTAHGMFNELLKIGNVLEDIQALNLISDTLINDGGGELDIIEKAIKSLSGFATDGIVNNLTGMSNALNSIVNDLTKTFPPEFKDLGKLLARKINDGFKKKLDLQSVLKSKIISLSTAGASEVGSKIAKAINESLKNNLNIGKSIHDSIVKALSENYSTKINVDMLTNKVDNSNSTSTKYPTVVMASGGRVATNSQLQDSSEKPLLSNGEYVIPKKIVNALGVPFFNKLRNGQISRTFAGLAQSVSHTTSSVVNNIYNNQTTTQHMNVYPSGHQDMLMISNRRVRV